MPPPLKRRQTGDESPLYKEGGAANAVTGDCFKSKIRQQQSSAAFTGGTSFLKEAP